MQKPPIKHNPAFFTDEELAKAFVVRHDDMKLIVDVIRENTRESNQHILVIGPRGIGKTMIVQRVALEVRRDEELSSKWYPLIFAEESYEVGSAGEFWLEAIFHLARQSGDPKWDVTYDELKREPIEDRLRERVLAQLMDFADSQCKRILLIVENLNMILTGQISEDDAWKLRGTLMHEPRLMLLATATAQIDLPENTNTAMFEMFKMHSLPPLNDEECQAVWKSITEQELGSRRIRAIRILTGGNPRLLAIISHFGANLSFAELMQDMTSLVDEHTDYFKSQLDALPPMERKVYVALADLWDPATAREVAAACRQSVSMASSLLKRLAGRGAVNQIPGKTRTKRYQVAERMYNIYYLMRRRGAPSERVKAVVQFMVQFYEEEELAGIAKRLTDEACRLSCERRQYHNHAFEGIIRTAQPGLRSQILEGTPWSFLEASDRPESLRQLLLDVGVGADCPCDFQRHPDERIARLIVRGSEAEKAGRPEEAEKTLQEAIAIDETYPVVWRVLGKVLAQQPNRKKEAEQAFRRAVDAAPADPCSWDSLGHFLAHEGRSAEAEDALRKAFGSYHDCCDAWIGLSVLSSDSELVTKARREAEEACERIIKKYPNKTKHWRKLADIRHHYTKRYVEAEAAYRKVIELEPEDVIAYARLGDLLHYELKKYVEAEVAYRKALELNPALTSALGGLGELLRDHLARLSEAKELFEKIIELGSSALHWAWLDIGILYERQERFTEAETACRKAIEIDPEFHPAWFCLAVLLHEKLYRYLEAELAYRKAIESDPTHTCPREQLVKLLLADKKQPEQAFELAEQSLAAIPDNARLLRGLAWQFLRFGPKYVSQAEGWARKAVALEDTVKANYTLACVLASQGKTEEAILTTRKVLDSPNADSIHVDDMIVLFERFSKAGAGMEALRVLSESKSALTLEPLAVALQLHMGMDVHVAPEIAEVAKDVLRRFQDTT